MAAQESRQLENEIKKLSDYILFKSDRKSMDVFNQDFTTNISTVSESRSISDKWCYLKIRGNMYQKPSFINIHAPMEENIQTERKYSLTS